MSVDILAILAKARESGLTKINLSTDNLSVHMEFAPNVEQSASHLFPKITEIPHVEEREIDPEDEASAKELTRQELILTDPLAFEDSLMRGDLDTTYDSAGGEA